MKISVASGKRVPEAFRINQKMILEHLERMRQKKASIAPSTKNRYKLPKSNGS